MPALDFFFFFNFAAKLQKRVKNKNVAEGLRHTPENGRIAVPGWGGNGMGCIQN